MYGISEKNKIIYVGIPKTGSQSFSNALCAGGPKNFQSGNYALEDFCIKYGYEKVSKYSKVASVRNPYDRIYSCWEYALRHRGISFKRYLELLSKYSKNIMDLDNRDFVVIDELINNNFPFDNQISIIGLVSMSNYIKHPRISIDVILSIDEIDESIKKINTLIDEPILELKHFNKTKSSDEKKYYKSDKKFIDLVNFIYENDFKNFNYNML